MPWLTHRKAEAQKDESNRIDSLISLGVWVTSSKNFLLWGIVLYRIPFQFFCG